MTNIRRRVALIAGTMLLAGAASSGVALASTPTAAPTTAGTAWAHHGGHGGYGGHGHHGGHRSYGR
ncbi:hypothetical protein ABZ890_11205 [Streptomyces sp. NPDC046984]|uniref:hypothetical protein n=1 Tax=Streptomyces sp. NPDC046984 TaxID=3155138 RepID=UPI0033FAD19B